MKTATLPTLPWLLLGCVMIQGTHADDDKQDPAAHAPYTLQERITALEDELAFLQEAAAIQTPQDSRIDFSFYVTLEYENFEQGNSRFDARNVELLVNASMTDRLKAMAEIEFERTANTETGNARAGTVEVEQGWLEYAVHDAFKPRFGVILVPFGKFNLEHFDPFRDLVDRPIVARRVVPVTWAEAGAGFTGHVYLGNHLNASWLEDCSINYQAFLINGLTDEFSDTNMRDARGAFGNDNNQNKAFVGRLGVSPVSEFELGFSAYTGAYDRRGNAVTGFDVDWDLSMGPLEFMGEYALYRIDRGLEADGATVTPTNMDGFYVQANYHFWFEGLNHTFLGSGFEDSTFTASIRYDVVRMDDDGDANLGDNKEERWTLGLNYRPTETYVFKINYQFNTTDHETLERGDRDGMVFSVSAAF